MMNNDRYNAGMAVRRSVMGDKYVDQSMQSATAFNQPFQELLTEYCWGAIWTRDGLDRKTRSIINLAMLTALNRPHEIAAHVRGALNNGLSETEISEVFMQAAVYCGVPAALDSFRIAQRVIAEVNSERDA